VQSITGGKACVRTVFSEGAVAKSNDFLIGRRSTQYLKILQQDSDGLVKISKWDDVSAQKQGLPGDESKYFAVDDACMLVY
jgi:hypothetical protein